MPATGSPAMCSPTSPASPDKALALLSEKDLIDWREALKVSPTTRQRTANDFRAALNRAARLYRDRLPTELAAIIERPPLNGEPVNAARDYSILADDDVRRIVQATKEVDAEDGWDGGLFRGTSPWRRLVPVSPKQSG